MRRVTTGSSMHTAIARALPAPDARSTSMRLPVAVVHLEAEAGRRADHVGVVSMIATSKPRASSDLTGDLAEAPEADHQHAAAEALGKIDLVHRRPLRRRELAQQQHGQRCQRHRQHHHRGDVRIERAIDDVGGGRRAEQHERELAALCHQHRAVERFGVAAARHARDRIDAQALDQHHHQHTDDDHAQSARNHGEVERHADRDEEQPEQDAAEGFDVASSWWRKVDSDNNTPATNAPIAIDRPPSCISSAAPTRPARRPRS